MRFYWPIAKVDREQRMVWGYASTEAEDDQGEVIRREALEAALADYMRFANIREMHQPSAVGVATEAAVDDRGLISAPGSSMPRRGRRSPPASTRASRSAAGSPPATPATARSSPASA